MFWFLRYMGCPPEQADPATRGLAEWAGQQLLAAVQPRWTWRAFDLSFEAEGVRLDCGLLLPGADLKASPSLWTVPDTSLTTR